jgi:hypothetical protein
MYGSVSSARNYDVRANPNLFDEAVNLLELSNSFISVPSGYPSAMGQSVRDLFRARDAMYEHFKKDRELGLKDIQLKKEAQEREKQMAAERERFRLEKRARLEARLKLEQERRQKEKLEKEERETKRFYELKGTIDDTDRRLTANINQLREDFFGAIKKQGDLFSELSSVREKDNADTIAQFNEALMESSNVNISLQSDVSKLNKETDSQKRDLETLRENFNNLSNLYNVSEEKLKLNESNLGNISKRQSATEKSLTGIQKKLDDNSVLFANEKEKLLSEIEAIKKNTTGDIQPRLNELTSKLTALAQKHDTVKAELLEKVGKVPGIQKKLDDNSVMFANEKENILSEIKAIKTEVQPRVDELTSKLTALTQKHDAVKTELLGKLKEQQALNKTQFEKLNAENEARGKRYDKDTVQLRRDLDVTRALADRMEEKSILAQNAFQEQEQRHKEQEKHNKARFKVLFDYQTNVNRQIKIQEKKTTNFAQLRRIRVMPDKAKALANFRRGRYALLEEFV